MGRLERKIPGRKFHHACLSAGLVGFLCLLPSPSPDVLRAAPAPWEDPVPRRDAEVSISTDQQMDFGQVADKDGSVTLGLADSIIADLDHMHFGGSPYSGIYTITGDPSTTVDISFTSNPANGFTLGSFVTSEGSGNPINATLNPAGQLVLTVGATLTLNAAQVSIGGGQTISFTITSTYN